MRGNAALRREGLVLLTYVAQMTCPINAALHIVIPECSQTKGKNPADSKSANNSQNKRGKFEYDVEPSIGIPIKVGRIVYYRAFCLQEQST